MSTVSKIAPAFVKAKKAFGPALKDKTNPAFRSRYADLGACLDAVEDALLNNGIALYQETFEDATGVTVETVLLHESGESIRCGRLHVPASKQDAQGYGSALTYCRRYSIMAACGIAPEDDDGNAASAKKPAAQAAPQGRIPDGQRLDFLTAITGAEDLAFLKQAYSAAYTTALQVNDTAAMAEFGNAKDKRKAQLETA